MAGLQPRIENVRIITRHRWLTAKVEAKAMRADLRHLHQHRDALRASLTTVATGQLPFDDQRPELSFRSRVGRFRIGVIEKLENFVAVSQHSAPELPVFRIDGSS